MGHYHLCHPRPPGGSTEKGVAEISVLLFLFIFTLARAEGNPLFLFYILNIQRTYFKQNGIIFAEISLSSLSHETIFPRSRFDLGEQEIHYAEPESLSLSNYHLQVMRPLLFDFGIVRETLVKPG